MRKTETKLGDSFIQDRLVSGVTSFHSPIKKIIYDYSQALEEQ